MAEFWFEYENNERSVSRGSWQILRQYLQHNTSPIKFLCIRGNDFEFNRIVRTTQYSLRIIDFDQDIIWENHDDTMYSRHIHFLNCSIPKLQLVNLLLTEINIDNSNINDFIIQKTEISQQLSIGNSKIQNIETNRGKVRTCYFKDSDFERILFSDFEIVGAFHIEGKIQINEMIIAGRPISYLCIKDTNKKIDIEFNSDVDNLVFSNNKDLNVKFKQIKIEFINISSCAGRVLFYDIQTIKALYFELRGNYNSEIIISNCEFSHEVKFKGNNFKSKKNISIKNSVFKELVHFNENNSLGLELSNVLFQKGVYIPIDTVNG